MAVKDNKVVGILGNLFNRLLIKDKLRKCKLIGETELGKRYEKKELIFLIIFSVKLARILINNKLDSFYNEHRFFLYR